MDVAAVTRQNRVYWEAIAAGRLGEPVEFFRAGGCALSDDELAATGDPAGLRVLHLACSIGDECLSFAQLGAVRVVGVDISPTHLATGRAKAETLGVDVDLREGDLTALDPELTGFDLIFISGGGICWVPDLDAWSRTVAERLAAGGRVVISEHHPLWEVLTVAGPNQLTVTGDYLDPTRRGYSDSAKAPQVTLGMTDPLPPHTSFVWSLGQVVTALLGAGLIIRALREVAQPELYQGLGPAAGALPAAYLLVAERPAAS
ncbi:class I SAM-dependent methyltransferase [Microlunatus speluncae]|uniref:class I SAM-dependent methyltransferase n=1 Tax=Microlunatus speluncae TaxID=2594267 RepID=UPI001266481A|nr:class I SAM-dependent methyltransferase [Microlunatus speluncae]